VRSAASWFNSPSSQGGLAEPAPVVCDEGLELRLSPYELVRLGWALDPAFAASHDVSPGFGWLTLNILNWVAKGS
jgi:hypothetical protein